MFKKIVLLAAACLMADFTAGCAVRAGYGYGRGSGPHGYPPGPSMARRIISPPPSPSSYRCNPDGRPAHPGTGWCTPHGPTPVPYSEPQYGYGGPPQPYGYGEPQAYAQPRYSSGSQYGGESHYGYGATFYGPQRYRYDRPIADE